ncbi:putative metal-dependent hydrolase of the TIM-barrel fold protein [Luteitalea pratensis]|uniref:Putative metal-dependent hydrolase of the TIM-barrel fold protein n=1 Tax=Luteitalea pratensis TaxID=1855912 RepID=A0A143PSF4_LUTPR|nr:amidohydrolase family protein [Luteitalea pratensis]AMY11088.1 putative metal-dependent hydrolase of the TIM-barrel fold protein [Luteitalea pratensis]
MKIDSHQHLWRFDPVEYGWIDEKATALRRSYLHADLARELTASGLDGAVAVQARQSLAENDFLLGQATASGGRIRGVVGWVNLAADDVDEVLGRYAPQPRFVGVRHVVQGETDPGFLARPAFNRGVSRLRRHGLVYDVLIYAAQLPAAIAFVDRHPSQPFVLDHIAKPTIAAGRIDEAWARSFREIAKRSHVTCKLSGVVTEVRDATWSIDVIRPYVDLAIEAFGPARLMFGSDWPVCRLKTEYGDWVRTVQALTSGWSAAEQAAFWGGTAATTYKLAPDA